ncbi:hypothetical protein F4X73_01205 [Candidatus Poribacteria bacterium]|nr:hypothetical protein [Candidatus Poribacteria bacterium]
MALTDIFIVGGECLWANARMAFAMIHTVDLNSDSRQVAIRRSLLQVFCAYFAKYFTHPNRQRGCVTET